MGWNEEKQEEEEIEEKEVSVFK